MKKSTGLFSVILLLLSSSWAAAEDWKGTPETSQFSFGGLTGVGIIDSSAGFALIGTGSKKIVQHGFIPDIADSVSIEAQLGPVFVTGGTAWFYSAHLRWDFEKDSTWTFYALGGAGGNILSVASVSRFELFPRIGVGAFWKITPMIQLRAELSHELIGLGVNIPL